MPPREQGAGIARFLGKAAPTRRKQGDNFEYPDSDGETPGHSHSAGVSASGLKPSAAKQTDYLASRRKEPAVVGYVCPARAQPAARARFWLTPRRAVPLRARAEWRSRQNGSGAGGPPSKSPSLLRQDVDARKLEAQIGGRASRGSRVIDVEDEHEPPAAGGGSSSTESRTVEARVRLGTHDCGRCPVQLTPAGISWMPSEGHALPGAGFVPLSFTFYDAMGCCVDKRTGELAFQVIIDIPGCPVPDYYMPMKELSERTLPLPPYRMRPLLSRHNSRGVRLSAADPRATVRVRPIACKDDWKIWMKTSKELQKKTTFKNGDSGGSTGPARGGSRAAPSSTSCVAAASSAPSRPAAGRIGNMRLKDGSLPPAPRSRQPSRGQQAVHTLHAPSRGEPRAREWDGTTQWQQMQREKKRARDGANAPRPLHPSAAGWSDSAPGRAAAARQRGASASQPVDDGDDSDCQVVDAESVPANESFGRPRRFTSSSGALVATWDVGAKPADASEKVAVYPDAKAKDAIALTKEELWRLNSREFLNDSLVDYQLKLLQAACCCYSTRGTLLVCTRECMVGSGGGAGFKVTLYGLSFSPPIHRTDYA